MNKGVIITIVIIIVLLLAGGGVMYFNSQNNSDDEEESTREVFIDEQPEPTDEPEEDYEKSDFSIQVLNGSGIPGEAGKAQTLLEDNDFVVDDTGNADTYDYRETEIRRKAEVPDEVMDELIDIMGSGDVSADEGDELDEDEDYDIIVIVGGEPQEEEGDVQGASDENTDDEEEESTEDEEDATNEDEDETSEDDESISE